jgi:hypothetical protein
VSAVHDFIVNVSPVLGFWKHQVHQISLILHAPNSQMLALVSKYTIEARIGRLFKPTYLEFEPEAPENLDSSEELETLTLLYH